MLVRGHKSQFNVVGSQFARKKQTLYISLTLKECIKLLPKEIENYILEYLDSNNIFAIDRAPKLILRSALHLENNGITYFKYNRMDKNQMVSHIQDQHIKNMQFWIYKALFNKVLKSLTIYNLKIKHKKKREEILIRKQLRIEQNIHKIKSIIHPGCIVTIKIKQAVTIGIVTACRDNSITAYILDDIVVYNGSFHVILTGQRKIVSYKYIRQVQYSGEGLIDSNLLFEKNDKTIELVYDEWSNSKILTNSIKSIL